ncbi:GNAT family N-acetyltransferase [Solirubrum puertoriconensis]|uniref:GNAT family N-acetyltransferase n=1 Tax=Solirubrum puertoriconensis TaxID=1751427 RepID=UPI001365EADF|nr:GNAT family N-acetyltransferase [Solirubrum puertoriconensis]
MTHLPSSDVSAAAVAGEVCALQSGHGRYQLRWQHEFTPAYPLAEELYLYLQPDQLAHANVPGQRLLVLLEDLHLGQTVGWWPVLIAPNAEARSPWQAPFGGPQLLRPDVPAGVLDEWLTQVHLGLAARGAQRLVQRLAPFAYEPRTMGPLVAALQRTGHTISLAEIDSYLPLEHAYDARLHPSERRRLHKCLRHGFRVEQEPPLLLPLAYEFLRRCREEKGQTLSLTQEQLMDLFRRFPREYLLFSVRDAAGEWVALTVAVLAGRGVLYNFFPASPLQYNSFSPVVLLNAGLHAFAQASGLRLLDLGTSTLPTGHNESLLRFKRHLGGVFSLKLTLERPL